LPSLELFFLHEQGGLIVNTILCAGSYITIRLTVRFISSRDGASQAGLQ